VVVGYFHNWNNATAPYIRLKDIDPKYNVVDIAFAIPVSFTDMTMTFNPELQTKAEFISDIRTLQAQGRKVIISIGGADAHVELKTTADKDKFVSSMKAIITEYGFDGFDIDLEGGSSLALDAGDTDFKNPKTQKMLNLIAACKEIVAYFRGQGKDLWLTSAPEVQYVQGGYGFYGSSYGSYLPFLHAVRDILTFVHVQYYNTGSQIALDEKAYSQGTADFIVAMNEMLLKGFPVARNPNSFFPAFRPDQVAFGLPATNSGAAPAGGHVPTGEVIKALDYLIKGTSYGGQYKTSGTYPGLRGIMTWSINWDKTKGYEFVNTYAPYFNALGGSNNYPTVNITAPANGSNFAPGTAIAITANASDSDGSVAKVEFFNGTTKLGEDTSSPYAYTWSGVNAGTYTLTAKATDNKGALSTSASVNITVGTASNQAPTATLSTNGTSFTAPASITLTATATDNDGSVSKVEFYNGSTKLGEDATAPYSFTWTNVAAGTYSLTATATDDKGANGTSTAVSVTVTNGGLCSVAAWSTSAVYVGTNRVSYNGNVYEARWWTQGEDPASKSGPNDVWKLIGACNARLSSESAETLTGLSVLYPNPAQAGSQVELAFATTYTTLEVIITNSQGTPVYTQTFHDTNKAVLALPKEVTGIYFVRVSGNGKVLKVSPLVVR
jgi:chitinase